MYFHRLSLGFNFKREMDIIEIGIYIPELKILAADMKIFFHGLSNKLRKNQLTWKQTLEVIQTEAKTKNT